MSMGFFLFESFKEDICGDVVPVNAYATTVRRKVIDIAAKIVSGGRRIKLKVSHAVWDGLDFAEFWIRCNTPPEFCRGVNQNPQYLLEVAEFGTLKLCLNYGFLMAY